MPETGAPRTVRPGITAFGDIALALAARLVPGLIGLLAVPFYVHSLGPDRYASVGFYLTIQMVVGLLDFGLSGAVLREAAWLAGQNAPADRFRTLLRTFELPFWGIALLMVAVGIGIGEPLLRGVFSVDPDRIGLGFPASALLFASIASRFPFAVYFGFLSGRGYIGRANLIVLTMDVVRTAGTVVLLLALTPSLVVFFGWQTFAAVTTSMLGAWIARRSSAPTRAGAHIEWTLYRNVRNLALGTGLLSLLYVLANSLDKIFLPRFLTTADYGLYVAVGQLAAVVFIVVQAIWSAQHPRLLIALAAGDTKRSSDIFVFTATLMTGVCSAAVFVNWLASPAFIRVWITGAESPETFANVLAVLTLGYAAAALSHLALSIQQAAKTMMPSLSILVAAVLVVPTAVYVIVGEFTALSGAIAWSGIYVAFLIGGAAVYLKHGVALVGLWCRTVLIPFSVSAGAAAFLSLWTRELQDGTQIAGGLGVGVLAFALNVAANRLIRERVKRFYFVGTPSGDKAASLRK